MSAPDLRGTVQRNPGKAGAIGALAVLVAVGAQPTVERWEGLRNDPYWDVARVRTVCYGETRGVQERYYPTVECQALLRSSLTEHTAGVLACLPQTAPLPTLSAFASFGYNVGVAAACGSTAAKRLRAGDIRGACDALLAWNKIRKGGALVFSQGVYNRRLAERDLCLKGLQHA